jgi:ferrous iron transport protein A
LTCFTPSTDTDPMLQMSVNREFDGAKIPPSSARTLAELKQGESGIIDRLDLPEDISRRLMELGFLPGHVVVPALSAPGGEPRVYRVDGSEVALRRETASRLILRPPTKTSGKALKP